MLMYSTMMLVVGGALILSLNHINFLQYQRPIPFKNIDKITFKDFKGFEFFRKELHGTEKFAYVITSIDYEIEHNELEVVAYFHPSESYVYNSNCYNNELLRHEMYHFRITEVYARKIKHYIKEQNIQQVSAIKSVISNFKKEENNFQAAYDIETCHGVILKKQILYQKKIDALLINLKKFKNDKIKLK